MKVPYCLLTELRPQVTKSLFWYVLKRTVCTFLYPGDLYRAPTLQNDGHAHSFTIRVFPVNLVLNAVKLVQNIIFLFHWIFLFHLVLLPDFLSTEPNFNPILLALFIKNTWFLLLCIFPPYSQKHFNSDIWYSRTTRSPSGCWSVN